MNNNKPLSYKLAIQNESYFNTNVKMVQRCEILLKNNIRVMNAELHWKPISKIV